MKPSSKKSILSKPLPGPLFEPLPARTILIVMGTLGAFLAVAAYSAMENRARRAIRPNEAAAVTVLKRYLAAQREFKEQGYAGVSGNTLPGNGPNAYADNFRNLHYGRDAGGRRLELIDAAAANAFLADNALDGAGTTGGESSAAAPYRGYLFQEDTSGLLPASEYGTKVAFMAFPARSDKTGWHVFWISEAGKVYSMWPGAEPGTPAAKLAELVMPRTPLNPDAKDMWEEL